MLSLKGTTARAMWSYAKSCAPEEMCGLLVMLGKVVVFVPVRNEALDREQEFVVSPEDHLALIEADAEIVGVVHSHVNVGARPSDLDQGAMVEGLAYVIVSLVDKDIRAWKKVGDAVVPSELWSDYDRRCATMEREGCCPYTDICDCWARWMV